MKIFDVITLFVLTDKPMKTDADMEARSEEAEEIRDKLEALFEQVDGFFPEGWKIRAREN